MKKLLLLLPILLLAGCTNGSRCDAVGKYYCSEYDRIETNIVCEKELNRSCVKLSCRITCYKQTITGTVYKF